MGDKKVTIMVIKVDLDCEKCRRKIKKTLCKIPQIQSQIYDEKANTVTVTVVCCSPEKIKQKICCKGGESVKGIEIKVPEKPKPSPPPPEKPKEAPKPKEPEKPKEPVKLKEPEKPKPPPEKPKVTFVDPPKPKAPEPAPKAPEPAPKPAAPAPKAPEPAPKQPEPAPKPAPQPVPSHPPPVMVGCMDFYGGHGGGPGPCWEGYGRPAPPCYGTPAPCYGRPVYDSWGGGGSYSYGGCRRGCYVGRCDCFSDENPSACSVM
ncbi:pollen-specific leucine-rich repeat extensin-like protein 1 [Mercurialis annua]|uniref:pollen-specific leucine-rich repeat extensin-like protein 1 n=1 Tax=Mercurialis annua TaxID=3986 RepID=UPI00215F6F7B|nr:pollen-specific leucine-rich repeat extensin-like protein 1 [Mercurialis annua]